jgi:hypothetical protein
VPNNIVDGRDTAHEPAASIIEADNFQQQAQISKALLGREGRALPRVVYTVVELGVEVS